MISYGEAMRYRKHINKIIENLDDESSLDVIDLFIPWKVNVEYDVDDKVRYNNKLYKCVQQHVSQESWTPDITPALWIEISIDEWPKWIQPIGVQDAYNIDDKVSHNDKHWISTINANVWEPGVYGWDEVL